MLKWVDQPHSAIGPNWTPISRDYGLHYPVRPRQTHRIPSFPPYKGEMTYFSSGEN